MLLPIEGQKKTSTRYISVPRCRRPFQAHIQTSLYMFKPWHMKGAAWHRAEGGFAAEGRRGLGCRTPPGHATVSPFHTLKNLNGNCLIIHLLKPIEAK